MKTILTLSFFISINAFAHIEPGTWIGKTPEGAPCSMIAGEEYFDHNLANPLNERVPVQVNSDSFVVQHPPVVDPAKGIVKFNHDFFHGILATKSGGRALVISMAHEPNFHGPKSFQVLDHQWKTDNKTAFICNDIKHQD